MNSPPSPSSNAALAAAPATCGTELIAMLRATRLGMEALSQREQSRMLRTADAWHFLSNNLPAAAIEAARQAV